MEQTLALTKLRGARTPDLTDVKSGNGTVYGRADLTTTRQTRGRFTKREKSYAKAEATPGEAFTGVRVGSTLTGRQGSPGEDVRIGLPHAFLDTLLGGS